MNEKTKPARTRDEVLAELLSFPGVSVSDEQGFGGPQEEQECDCDACLAEDENDRDEDFAESLDAAETDAQKIISLCAIVMSLSKMIGYQETSTAAHNIWFDAE